MKRFVIDTCALMRYFQPDGPVPAEVEDALRQAWERAAFVYAPQLLIAEVAHVLLKKERRGLLSTSECDRILADVLSLPFQWRDIVVLGADVLTLGRAHGLSAYDATFLALARRENAVLITADDRLANRAARGG